ncbi:MAG TPA: glycosyltransferase family 39 protein [Vicinamibacteria bacterium]|nr:glycosyltransferase family 39 protein [Vicinamibacteria bacterium]
MNGATRLRWPALLSLYLASRLAGLTLLPIFLDERIHLRWAYWIAQGDRLRLPFISGRGLSVWLLAGVAPPVDDPLLAGRLLTVAVGTVTLVACHHLARRATGSLQAADVAALFYIACPFTLFYDRMILTDAFLSAFTALTLLLALGLAETPRLRTGVLLGLALGMGVLSKTTGLLLFAVPLLALMVARRDRRRALLVPLAAAHAVAVALVAYPLWLFFRRTSELAGALGKRENEASLTANVATNLRLATEWLGAYWTAPLIVLAAAGLAFAVAHRERRRPALLLAVLAVVPTLAFVAVSEIWYPRYLLFTTVPLLPLAAGGFVSLVDALASRARLGPRGTGALTAAALVLALLPALRFDARLWTDPAGAPLPGFDRFQYVTGWPSGYGLRDTVAFLHAERERGGGLLLVTPGPSTTAGAVRLLSRRDPEVEVRHVDPASVADPHELDGEGPSRAVFVIVSLIEGVQLPEAWVSALEPVFASFKPNGAAADRLYRVCAPPGCR